MTVRLLRPYKGQAVNTLYTGTADEEVGLLAGTADGRIELATDYQTYLNNMAAARLTRGGLPMANAALNVVTTTPTGLAKFRKARALLRLGTLGRNLRVAFVGDSKTMFSPIANSSSTDGGFARSRPAQFAAQMRRAGFAVYEGWAGSAGIGSIAGVLAYDPRRSGFSGWGGGVVSLGGPSLATGNTNPGNFQLTAAVDRCSTFYYQNAGSGQFTITKGAETSGTINGANATPLFVRYESVYTTKDTNPIVTTRSAGGFVEIIGQIAWDSATPGIEVMNFGVFGVTSAYQASTTAVISPLNALQAYAPDLTIINLGTNDINTGVPMATWLANIQAIITGAQISGSVILNWPSIGGVDGNYGTDATRLTWNQALQALATSNNCMFSDHEALLGGRAASQAAGAYGDGVHQVAFASDIEANPISQQFSM